MKPLDTEKALKLFDAGMAAGLNNEQLHAALGLVNEYGWSIQSAIKAMKEKPESALSKIKLKPKREYLTSVIKKALDEVSTELEAVSPMTEEERTAWLAVRYDLHQTYDKSLKVRREFDAKDSESINPTSAG
jgi:hypothetical protein